MFSGLRTELVDFHVSVDEFVDCGIHLVVAIWFLSLLIDCVYWFSSFWCGFQHLNLVVIAATSEWKLVWILEVLCELRVGLNMCGIWVPL